MNKVTLMYKPDKSLSSENITISLMDSLVDRFRLLRQFSIDRVPTHYIETEIQQVTPGPTGSNF